MPIFVKDLQGRYIMINGAGAKLLGRSVAKGSGKDDREFFSPETARLIMEKDRQVLPDFIQAKRQGLQLARYANSQTTDLGLFLKKRLRRVVVNFPRRCVKRNANQDSYTVLWSAHYFQDLILAVQGFQSFSRHLKSETSGLAAGVRTSEARSVVFNLQLQLSILARCRNTNFAACGQPRDSVLDRIIYQWLQ